MGRNYYYILKLDYASFFSDSEFPVSPGIQACKFYLDSSSNSVI